MKKVKNKYIIIVILLFLILLSVLIYFLTNTVDKNVQALDEKISLLEDKYFNTEEMEKQKSSKDILVIISVGNGDKQAVVVGKKRKKLSRCI